MLFMYLISRCCVSKTVWPQDMLPDWLFLQQIKQKNNYCRVDKIWVVCPILNNATTSNTIK